MSRKEIDLHPSVNRAEIKDEVKELRSLTPETFELAHHVVIATSVAAALDPLTEKNSSAEYALGKTIIRKKSGFLPGRNRLIFSTETGDTKTTVTYKTTDAGYVDMLKISRTYETYPVRFDYSLETNVEGGTRKEKAHGHLAFPHWQTIWKKKR